MQSDIVQRLDALIKRQRDARGDMLYKGSADPELVDARAEITRLTEALRLQMEAKHKEAAEAKLWFQKAQEWKEALRAAEERADERYQQAIADVVEWLTKERLSDTADHYAQLITRRFGKDA